MINIRYRKLMDIESLNVDDLAMYIYLDWSGQIFVAIAICIKMTLW